jgi:L-asparaginase II
LARTGVEPTALHNNCSGKHAGFLCLACALGLEPRGYVDMRHEVQQEVKQAVESVTGAGLTPDACGIDGCSIPTWAVPLSALAHGFARFGTGHGFEPERAKAAARLRAACAAQPYFVAGTGRFCTEVMTLLRARAFVKTGAEGVFCGALPELGLGIAVKCDDGGTRAAEVVMANLIVRFLPLDDAERRALERWVRPVLRNWSGIEVGAIRATGDWCRPK